MGCPAGENCCKELFMHGITYAHFPAHSRVPLGAKGKMAGGHHQIAMLIFVWTKTTKDFIGLKQRLARSCHHRLTATHCMIEGQM